jgi:hypothetical protein
MATTREKIVEQPRATAVSGLAKQLRQLSDVRRNPLRLTLESSLAALPYAAAARLDKTINSSNLDRTPSFS